MNANGACTYAATLTARGTKLRATAHFAGNAALAPARAQGVT